MADEPKKNSAPDVRADNNKNLYEIAAVFATFVKRVDAIEKENAGANKPQKNL